MLQMLRTKAKGSGTSNCRLCSIGLCQNTALSHTLITVVPMHQYNCMLLRGHLSSKLPANLTLHHLIKPHIHQQASL